MSKTVKRSLSILCAIALLMSCFAGILIVHAAPGDIIEFTDELDTLDLTSDYTGLEHFPNHTDSKISVVMRGVLDAESSLTYAKEGYVVRSASFVIKYHKNWNSVSGRGMKVWSRASAKDEWTEAIVSDGAQLVEGINGSNFNTMELKITGLVTGATEIKYELVNTAAKWTAGIDSVSITWAVDPMAPIYVTDELDTLDLISESANIQHFPNHTDSKISVVMRKNTSEESSITYTNPGYVASTASFVIKYHKNWNSVSGRSMKVWSRASANESWVEAIVTDGDQLVEAVNGSNFNTMELKVSDLVAGATEVKFELTNTAAAWTAGIDSVTIGWTPDPNAVYTVTDELDTFDQIDGSVNVQHWPNHTDAKISMVMRKTIADGESSFSYSKLGYQAVGAKLVLVYHKNWNSVGGRGMKIWSRASADDVWVEGVLTDGEQLVEGINGSNFNTMELIASGLVPGATEVKVELVNTAAAWTAGIDAVSIDWKLLVVDDEPDDPNENLAVFNDQKIGILSDAHFADYDTDADTTVRTMLEKFKAEGVSAVVALGDMANTGLPSQYKRFTDIWDDVFGDMENAPELIALMGNHEFEQAYYNRETVEDAYNNFKAAYGYDTVNLHKVVNGVHIITVNSETAAVKGGFTETTTEWLAEQLAIATEADPYQPILVFCHEYLPNGGTHAATDGNSNAAALYAVMKDYKRVVFFAGHAHFPAENEKSIMQKDFTCVDVPSIQYTSLETGTPADAYSAQGAMMVNINGTDKTFAIHRLRIDGANNDSVTEKKEPWVLSLPLKKKTFTYTSDRFDDRTAPTFAADAVVTVGDTTTNSCVVTFPAASHDDYVQTYTVSVFEKNGATDPIITKTVSTDFFIDMDNMKDTIKVDIGGLTPNTEIVVEVVATESFGVTSAPITGEGATEPVTTLSDALGRADFLDVNFMSGYADNSPYRRNHTLYGANYNGKFIFSEELNRQVLDVDGWINYPTTQGTLTKITDSFTVETAFRYNGAFGTSQCLLGNPESGGISLEVSSGGILQMAVNVGGTWKYAKAPELLPDTWYHVIATYDGNVIKLFINGVKVSETEAPGTVKYNPAMNWFTIGANSGTAGNAASKFVGEMALARVYTDAMTEGAANTAFSVFQKEDVYNEVYKTVLLFAEAASTLETWSEEDWATMVDLLADAETLLNSTTMTRSEANAYLAEAEVFINKLRAENPSLAWEVYQDPCDTFTMAIDKSEGWQRENNQSIKKTIFTKNNNIDTYLTYKVDGYIRSFELDATLYAGFGDADRDFAFFVSEDGEDWKQVYFKSTEPVDDPAYGPDDAVAWLNTTCSPIDAIGGTYNYLKVVLYSFESGVNWSVGLDDVRIYYSDVEDDVDMNEDVFYPEEVLITDAYDTLDLPTKQGDNLLLYAPHAETNLNVVGRNGSVGDSSLRYLLTGYRISDFTLKVQYAPDYTAATDIVVSVRAANTNDWTEIELIWSDPEAIEGSSTDVFKSAVLTPAVELPEDAMEIKVEMANSVIWTMFLDNLDMTWVASGLIDDPEEEITGPTAPEIEYNFVDELVDEAQATEMSDNWEFFNPHPESDLTVAGKTNGKKGTLIYSDPEKAIDNFAVKLQVAPAFFNPDNYLYFEVMVEGSDEWVQVPVAADYMVKINGTFSTCWIQPTEELPANVTQLRLAFYNDVAWTLFVDEVHIDYVDFEGGNEQPSDGPSEEPSDEPSDDTNNEESNPDSGVASAGVAAAAAVILSGAVLFVTFRRKED